MWIKNAQLTPMWILYSIEIAQTMSILTINNEKNLQLLRNSKHVSWSYEFHVNECNETLAHHFAPIIAHMTHLHITSYLKLFNQAIVSYNTSIRPWSLTPWWKKGRDQQNMYYLSSNERTPRKDNTLSS